MSASELGVIDWAGDVCQIEYAWVGQASDRKPLMVFLHEGLGSLAMWRDFPERLCTDLGWQGLVYSRPGYGRSTPRQSDIRWRPDFLSRQAVEVLPAILDVLNVSDGGRDIWLFGHSDGGSIALLHAAACPGRVAGVIALAPHINVEPISIASIEKAREAYLTTDLRSRLARYHDDPDSAFWGWNDVWLSSEFRCWTMEAKLADICCPVLAVQGVEDQYGTMEQIDGIQRVLPGTEVLKLESCGHSAHKDCPDQVIDHVRRFVSKVPS